MRDNMIRHHLARSHAEPQRRRWLALQLECADEIGLPDDPEFRSAFVAYLEWGTRLAVLNSQPGAQLRPGVAPARLRPGHVADPTRSLLLPSKPLRKARHARCSR